MIPVGREMDEAQIQNAFKNHVATLEKHGPIEFLEWRNPNSSTYLVRYFTHGRSLMITGDLGDAIMEWSEPVDVEWIAGCCFGYYAGKIQASRYGGEGKVWEPSKAKAFLDHWFADNPQIEIEKLGTNPYSRISSQEEWIEYLVSESDDCFCGDTFEYGSIGQDYPHQIYAHFRGLQMAVEQLKKRREANVPEAIKNLVAENKQ